MKNSNILIILLFSSLHESAHLLSLIIFKGQPIRITFAFYGIGLKYDYSMHFIKELIFLLSGVMLNSTFYLFGIEKEINGILALINILPLYPLDGGRALKLILNKAFSLDASDRVFRAISAICIIALIIWAISSKSVSLALIIIYILLFSFNNSFD